MYSLTWLPFALRAAGLTVIEFPDWKYRGDGDVGEIKLVVCHHSVSPKSSGNAPSLRTVAFGRKGPKPLKGPLSQLVLGRDGTFYIIAAGLGNHCGPGEWHGITQGNSHAIGIEAENDGVSEPWPEKQMDAYARGCAAILKHIGSPVEMCIGHKEWCIPKGRKVDPNFDMDAFRDRVKGFMS